MPVVDVRCTSEALKYELQRTGVGETVRREGFERLLPNCGN